MRHIDINEISFFQINLFIVAGNELNYTHTASICHVSQPTVSRSMEALEQTTGIQLFIKKNGAMKLTPAGKYLHERLQKMMMGLQNDLVYSHELQEGLQQNISIAFPDSVDPSGFIIFMSEALKNMNDFIQIKYSMFRSIDSAIRRLLNYEADVAFVHLHARSRIEQYTNIEYRPFLKIPLMAYMLRTNPLSCRKTLSIGDLRSQRLIVPAQQFDQEYFNLIERNFFSKDIAPLISKYVNSPMEGIYNVLNDNEVMISDRFLLCRHIPDCVGVEIENTESGFLILWRRNEGNEGILKNYLGIAEEFAKVYR